MTLKINIIQIFLFHDNHNKQSCIKSTEAQISRVELFYGENRINSVVKFLYT